MIWDKIRRYDRMIVTFAAFISAFVAFYLATQSKIDAIINNSNPIKEIKSDIKIARAVQENININVDKKLDQIMDILYDIRGKKR